MPSSRLIAVFACLMAAAAPLLAQPSVTGETERARLNAAQAEAARRQIEANAANQRAYDAALKAYHAAAAARDEAVALQQAEATRLQAEYDAALKQWEQAVAACKKGERKRCAPVTGS